MSDIAIDGLDGIELETFLGSNGIMQSV